MLEIGQSAVLLPKIVIVDNGRYSETERVLVNNDGLAILNLLKIQSDLIGNYRDTSGDEMNCFCVQDLEVAAELKILATSTARIMSCQSTKNIICITQDALLAAYLLTKEDFDLGRDKFFDICMKGDNFKVREGWTIKFIMDGLERIEKVNKSQGKKYILYSGKSLYSLMLPDNFNYNKKNDARVDEPTVKIVKGVLLEGALNKANLGQAHNSLVHVLYKEYSAEESMGFINNCQFIGNQYLLHRSFTVGIKDCVADLRKFSENIAYKCFIEAKDTESTISHDRIRELKICAILDKARDMSMKLAKAEMKKDNAFMDTVTSGAKGEIFNISQITSMLGQQIHLGRRIQKCMSGNRRTLPHYPVQDIGLEQEYESAGFIKSSFLNGLNPQEFIWHAVSAREGCSNKMRFAICIANVLLTVDCIYQEYMVNSEIY